MLPVLLELYQIVRNLSLRVLWHFAVTGVACICLLFARIIAIQHTIDFDSPLEGNAAFDRVSSGINKKS